MKRDRDRDSHQSDTVLAIEALVLAALMIVSLVSGIASLID